MLDSMRMIWKLVGARTRRGVGWIGIALLMTGLLESCGLGLFLPILGLIFDPESIDRIPGARWAFENLAGGDTQVLLAQFCSALLVFFVLKTIVVGAVIYEMNRFLMTRQAEFSRELLRRYLERNYAFHLDRNSSELVRNIIMLSTRLYLKGMFPILQAATEFFTLAGVTAVLLWVHPLATLLLISVLSGAGIIFYWGLRKPISRWGEKSIEFDRTTLQAANEALGSVKMVILGGHSQFFTDAYSRPALERARYLALSHTAAYMPRLFIEVAAIGTMLSVLIALLYWSGDNPVSVLPTLAIFGIAGLRLMPAISRIIAAATQIRENSAAVNILDAELIDPITRASTAEQPLLRARHAEPPRITLENVSFGYTEGAAVLRNIHLDIPAGQSVAIVGPSGAGKTTLIDVLLGLLELNSGRVLADGADTGEDIERWQRRIGYVPQNIYLIDDSLARNVALGQRDDEIDHNRLNQAIQVAQLDDVVSQLPDGINTILGEGGSRLSGGQRQRVGIARALYSEPDVLVMDEATSALDMETEHRIDQALAAFSGNCTVIVIAHHLATIRKCSQIVMIDSGRICGTGNFESLSNNPDFSRLLELSSIPTAAESIDVRGENPEMAGNRTA
jgi:ABC-type multidrug transport system fused ATPase/permease subunit